MKLTASQIVKRFLEERVLIEPVSLNEIAVFTWQQFEECPPRSIIRNAWTLIKALSDSEKEPTRVGNSWRPSFDRH